MAIVFILAIEFEFYQELICEQYFRNMIGWVNRIEWIENQSINWFLIKGLNKKCSKSVNFENLDKNQ